MSAQWKQKIGPPGCGKTASQLRDAAHEMKANGIRPDRLAFVTFTRTARQEARERFASELNLQEDDMPWVRTIHATAWRLQRVNPGQIVNDRHWHEFGAKFGYQFSQWGFRPEDGPGAAPTQSEDDKLRALHDWQRNCRLTVDVALARTTLVVAPDRYRTFVARYIAYKQAKYLKDFTDLLECALASPWQRPDVDVAFVDEAQDLSPLQIAVVELWFSSCERVLVAGDDDQSIFGFQGANPAWLISMASKCQPEILGQSYRVPRSVLRMAQKIIGQNANRIPKTYLPRTLDGNVVEGVVDRLDFDAALRNIDDSKSVLVLARNRCFLDRVAKDFVHRGIAFSGDGGQPGPLDDASVIAAIRVGTLLQQRRPILVTDLVALLAHVPSNGHKLLPHGAKKKVETMMATHANCLNLPIDRATVEGLFAGGTILDVIAKQGPIAPLKNLPNETVSYFDKVTKRHGTVFTPKVTLTTIHGAKGREADTVILLSDMTAATYRESVDHRHGGAEAENRVAYVAATRAKERLVIVPPMTGLYYPYPRAA